MRCLLAVLGGLLEPLRTVADGLDLMAAHELEAVTAILELGHGVEANDFAAISHGRGVIQLFVEVNQFKLVALANIVSGDTDGIWPERRARSIRPLYPMMT